MIAVVWRTPRLSREDDGLFEKFKNTPGIVSSYQLGNDDEVVVVSIWESAEKREAYMKTALQAEILKEHPGQTRQVYEVLNSQTGFSPPDPQRTLR